MNAPANLAHQAERIDLAAAFRWTARLKECTRLWPITFRCAVNPEGHGS
jgi:hypothetical protein